MKITSLPFEELLIIYLDENEWHRGHQAILGKKLTFEAENEVEAEELYEKKLLQGAKRFILRRLSIRGYNSHELIAVLTERLVPIDIIEPLIQEFTSLGYINDSAWLEAMIRQLQRQKYGPGAIARKLRDRKIPESAASAAISSLCNEETNSLTIRKLLQTRYRSRDLSNPKDKKNVIAALIRKGFMPKDIFAEIKRVVMLLY
jgi:SOS response regulatory protein OraA/RecX